MRPDMECCAVALILSSVSKMAALDSTSPPTSPLPPRENFAQSKSWRREKEKRRPIILLN